MTERRKTLLFAGVAVLLAAVTLLTAPRKITPDAFLDQGELFFPDFTDPNAATTLEVIEFDEETASAKPFKVTFKDGPWTIPSHHDYPADGKDQLARTAAGIVDIRKQDFRSANVADHEACGVIDPLDETVSSLKGRGKRVTIRGSGDQVLADLIIGKKLEGQESLYFVRIPGQKRVYVSRIDIEVSTKFEDWIERDLLQVDEDALRAITVRDYSINERTGRIEDRDTLELRKRDGTWRVDRMPSGQSVDTARINELTREIDGLSIVGVRPKPPGLSASLKLSEEGASISQADLLSLQSRGYYFTRDGSLVSNEGELEVSTAGGLVYTLRFGEVLYGTGEAVSAGGESTDDRESGPGENRYLFLTVVFDPKLLPEPARPSNLAFLEKAENDWSDADRKNRELQAEHQKWEDAVRKGRALALDLNGRFADWYYVISAESFDRIRVRRSDILTSEQS